MYHHMPENSQSSTGMQEKYQEEEVPASVPRCFPNEGEVDVNYNINYMKNTIETIVCYFKLYTEIK